LNGDLFYNVGKGKEATFTRIPIGKDSISALTAKLPLSAETKSEVLEEFFAFPDTRALTEVNSTLMRYTNYSVVFFDKAEVEAFFHR
jgi:hypothetical protein